MFRTIRRLLDDRNPPSEEWIQKQASTTRYTKDWYKLSQYRAQLLFTYSNDMPGYPQFDNLIGPEAVRWGHAYTAQDMTLVIKKGSIHETFAIALEREFKYTSPIAAYSPIRGELLSVDPSVLTRTDRYYQNTEVFIRKRVKLICPYQDRHLETWGVAPSEGYGFVEAWMYIGVEKYWEENVDMGFGYYPSKTFDNIFVKQFLFFGAYDFSPE